MELKDIARPYRNPVMWSISVTTKVRKHYMQFETYRVKACGHIEAYEKFLAKYPKLFKHHMHIAPYENGMCMTCKSLSSDFIKQHYDEVSLIEYFEYPQFT